MSTYNFHYASPTVTMARWRNHLTPTTVKAFGLISYACGAVGFGGLILGTHHAAVLAGLGLLLVAWHRFAAYGVMKLRPKPLGSTERLELLLPPELAAGWHKVRDTASLWQLLSAQWQTRFLLVRFMLPSELVGGSLSDWPFDANQLIDLAGEISRSSGTDHLTTASFTAALAQLSPGFAGLLTAVKLEPADLVQGVAWLSRTEARADTPRPIYGGLARDWAAGYTPTLSHYGQNFSRQIEQVRGNFVQQERTSQLDALISALASASGSVAVVGETGIGKTALLYGLADRILQGNDAKSLRHYQVVSLNASVILASAGGPGDIERIVLQLFGEAIHAGNIIIALDEAQLFFGQGVGAVNLSQVLLPVVQSRNLKLILTITPGDWQRLRSTNTALSSLLTPVVLTEPSVPDTLQLLADRALLLEQGRLFVTYQALRETIALSSRYYPDEANPGRSLKLLEGSLTYPEGQLITPTSIAQAVESQFGVKAQTAGAAEADTLLHLEDHIHARMINQTRAVNVVAAALRRARAGVANPKRPIGSFLFLGPTGVGKTELARSLAAVYFGDETNMIRLDMSEYQQPADVSRLLASAAENPQGLLPKLRTAPFSVVLFDEIEKAHPNILNLMLQLLDEGNLTDAQNKPTSFKDAIIIATSNAGADEIRRHIEAGEQLEQFEKGFTDQLISSGSFKPELLNRFDEIVLFRPLNEPELGQVVGIMVAEVNKTLAAQKVSVELTPEAVAALVHAGYDPRLGARPMRRMVQRSVEDAVAGKILRGETAAGTVIHLDVADLGLTKTA